MKRWLTATVVVGITLAAPSGIALAASSPAVTTRAPSSVQQQSAVLNGTTNPNGSATTYYFQWGLDQNYGVNGAIHSAGAGTKAVKVHETAAGLIPGTTYHFRLVATNKSGTSFGADRTFKTAGHPPPGVTTGPASQVGQHSVTLTGVINPNGANTTWYFQWGTSTAYTNNTTGGTVAGTSPPVIVAQALSGLQAGTIFHYRLVGANGPSGALTGADQIFMTYPTHRPKPRVTRRVTPLHARRHQQTWTYTISGTVGHPASTPAQFACTGFVGVRFFTGGKRVKFALAPVQSNCTYSTQVVFHHKPGRGPRSRVVTMNVFVHYRGNGYLAPSNARKQTVTLR